MLVTGIVLTAALARAPASAEDSIALVIGNAAYPTAALRNPVNDATAIAARLRTLGYEVTLRTNVTQREMTRAVSQFGQALKPGSVGLFYYAGHGMQVRGRNFLVPVDADIQSEASARSEAVDVDLVLEQLGPTRLSMVILDACRNNPFEGRFRSGGGSGLAQIDAPKGTLLAYATAPGKVASDGDGSHGLYTAELLKAMDIPGAKVEEVFKAVRVNVIKATAGQQIPWESSSLTGDYYFRPAAPAVDAAKIARDTESKQAELQAKLEAERRQREKDAQMLKAEMEKLRQEVRRLTETSAPAEAKSPVVAATEDVPAKRKSGTEPIAAKDLAPPRKDATQPPGAPTDSPVKESAAGKIETAKTAAPVTTALLREKSGRQWAHRIEMLEGERGRMTFSKAGAILFAPLTDDQLLVLVTKERTLNELPYSSALALGIGPGGGIGAGRAWNERTPDIAARTAVERCNRGSRTPCRAVVVNGEFRDAAFLEWAREAAGKSILKMRADFLRVRAGHR